MAVARPRPQAIRLTEAAADRIKYVMANATHPIVGVRVGVQWRLRRHGLYDGICPAGRAGR